MSDVESMPPFEFVHTLGPALIFDTPSMSVERACFEPIDAGTCDQSVLIRRVIFQSRQSSTALTSSEQRRKLDSLTSHIHALTMNGRPLYANWLAFVLSPESCTTAVCVQFSIGSPPVERIMAVCRQSSSIMRSYRDLRAFSEFDIEESTAIVARCGLRSAEGTVLSPVCTFYFKPRVCGTSAVVHGICKLESRCAKSHHIADLRALQAAVQQHRQRGAPQQQINVASMSYATHTTAIPPQLHRSSSVQSTDSQRGERGDPSSHRSPPRPRSRSRSRDSQRRRPRSPVDSDVRRSSLSADHDHAAPLPLRRRSRSRSRESTRDASQWRNGDRSASPPRAEHQNSIAMISSACCAAASAYPMPTLPSASHMSPAADAVSHAYRRHYHAGTALLDAAHRVESMHIAHPIGAFPSAVIDHLQLHVGTGVFAYASEVDSSGGLSPALRQADAQYWIGEFIRARVLQPQMRLEFVYRCGAAEGYQLLLQFASSADRDEMRRRLEGGH
jgi:hypothetical protein